MLRHLRDLAGGIDVRVLYEARLQRALYEIGVLWEEGLDLVTPRLLAMPKNDRVHGHAPAYRTAKGVQAALAEIEQGRGTAYHSAAVDGCLRLFRGKGYCFLS